MQNLIDVFTLLNAVKMGTAIFMVVLLSVIAETAGPRFAGLLSGYPLGAAISLFFMGHDIGPQFAAESAPYTALGLIATQAFAYCYYRASLAARGLNRGLQVLGSALGGIAGYLAACSFLVLLPGNLVLAVFLPFAFIFLCIYLFRGVKTVRIEKKPGFGPKTLLARALFAAVIIVAVTSAAGTIGTGWAGVFSSFPMTILPMVAIVHLSHDPEHAHAILKHVPRGLGAVVVFAVAVSLTYPDLGIYAGTAIGYGFATLFLLASQWRSVLAWRGLSPSVPE